MAEPTVAEQTAVASTVAEPPVAEAVPRRHQVASKRERGLGEVLDVDDTYVPEKARRHPLAGLGRGLGVIADADPRRIPGSKRPLFVIMLLTAVTAWDTAAYTLLLPEIQATYHLSLGFIVGLTSASFAFLLLLNPVLGFLADRVKRVLFLGIGYSISGVGRLITPFAPSAGFFALGRVLDGSGGLNLAAPFQTPLLADWYPTRARSRVFAGLGQASAVGGMVGLAVSGFLALAFGWRATLLLIGAVGVVATALIFTLREPVRGYLDRIDSGASAEVAEAAQEPLSFAEGFRTARSIVTIRRIWYATPFIYVGGVTFNTLLALYFAEEYGLGPGERAVLGLIVSSASLVAMVYSGAVGDRMLATRPARIMTAYGGVLILVALMGLVLAFSHSLVLSVMAFIPVGFFGVLIAPAEQALTTLVLPARVRGLGASLSAPWQLLGIVAAPILANSVTGLGVRDAILVTLPFVALGGVILATASSGVERDIRAARVAAMADEEARRNKEAGRTKMLLCRQVEVAYSGVQVLFGVDFDVEAGEIVALMGTNGAGKSTLLRAIAGVTEASNGAIFLDGRDISHSPPYQNAEQGVVMVPGGHAVFPGLTVAENLRTAAWLSRDDEEWIEARREEVLDLFPVLRPRLSTTAGNLSGGEQQMVAVGQALLMKPRLLMIDELSLGLAPAVVDQLIGVLRRIHDQGTTIILVEQSLNVALTIAERAVFMEKGEIRFDGSTSQLLDRPDLVRAVFMGGAPRGGGRASTRRHGGADRPAVLRVDSASVSFGGVRALDAVSLDVGRGEIVGCIGPNGAGKTTLFDVVSGFVEPDEGRIFFEDDDVTRLPPDRRAMAGLGRSFQNAMLFPSITVRENIAMAMERQLEVRSAVLYAFWTPPARRQERRVDRRVAELIDQLGLGAYADKFVSELSAGTRRAVDIACAMASGPELLLLDEPAAGLAQAEAEALGPMLQRLVRETGVGLLVIEHDLPLITSISTRLVAMELGSVLAVGPPGEVVKDPRVITAYLAASDDVVSRSGSPIGTVAAILTSGAAADPMPPADANPLTRR